MVTFSAFRSAFVAVSRSICARKYQPCHPYRQFRTVAHRPLIEKQPLKNEKIPYPTVQLVDPETQRLRPSQPLNEVLALVNKKTHFLELVSETPSPIVKIICKKAAFDKKKQLKERLKEASRRNTHKEVQLTWGVDMGDLNHKLKKVREDLEKGYRVDVVFAPKSGQTLPSRAEMRARADETVALLADVGKEWKAREVRRAAIALFLQGYSVHKDSDLEGETILRNTSQSTK